MGNGGCESRDANRAMISFVHPPVHRNARLSIRLVPILTQDFHTAVARARSN
jgi:hypothetical protein